jgi:Flp pilus assembly protein TadG
MTGRVALGPRRVTRESGAAAVEAVLVFTFVLFPLLLGGMQLILATVMRQQTQAAARDGSRQAILHYQGADSTGSSDWTIINSAVRGRLIFGGDVTWTARCTTPSGSSVSCASAQVDVDRVAVMVSSKAYSLFYGISFGRVDSTSSDVIVGLPQ